MKKAKELAPMKVRKAKAAEAKARKLFRSRKFWKKWSYSIEQAGKQIGLSRAASYRAVGEGFIPTDRIGKRLLRVPRARWDRIVKQAIARENRIR
jgi:hypothetical protein